jgi:hypothetical protein
MVRSICRRFDRERPERASSGGERLDHLEDFAHLALVAGERDIFGERVGDDDETRRRELTHHDRAARRDLLVALGVDLDRGGFLLHTLETAGDPRAKTPQHFILLERREPDQHDHAVAEQHAISGGPNLERERRRRDHVAALEAGGVDPFAQQQGTGGESRGRGGWGGGRWKRQPCATLCQYAVPAYRTWRGAVLMWQLMRLVKPDDVDVTEADRSP